MAVGAVTQPANGTVVITGGGTGLTYQPNANYCNTPPGTTLDTFTYTLTPGGSTATVSVTVTCVDDAPVAVDDTATVVEDDAATAIPVLANDTDADGGPISIASVTQPANGTVVITGGGTGLTYQPNAELLQRSAGDDAGHVHLHADPGRVDGDGDGDGDLCRRHRRWRSPTRRRWPRMTAATAIDVLANDTDVDGGPIVDRHGDPAGQRHGGDHRWRDRADLSAERQLLQHPAGHDRRTRSPTR